MPACDGGAFRMSFGTVGGSGGADGKAGADAAGAASSDAGATGKGGVTSQGGHAGYAGSTVNLGGESGNTSSGSGGSSQAGTGASGSAGAASDGPLEFFDWPGANTFAEVDAKSAFDENLSGLTYQPASETNAAVLWAAQNKPSKVYRLEWDGKTWSKAASGNWSEGKTLLYPAGSGSPDAEGITTAEANSLALYVATERDNDRGDTSRLSVLRFDGGASQATLVASHEWNLTASLPSVGANIGMEAITWIPDSFLVSRQFYDQKRGATYSPTEYPEHGTGLFFVAIEQTGMIYAFALNHSDQSHTLIASVESGLPAVMGMEFDRDVGYLWANCDDACSNHLAVLELTADVESPRRGRFVARKGFNALPELSAVNNEGLAILPESTCQDQLKGMLWSDDASSGSHALRMAKIPCGDFISGL